MPIRHAGRRQYQPGGPFVARKAFTFAGTDFKPHDPFPHDVEGEEVAPRVLVKLFDANKIDVAPDAEEAGATSDTLQSLRARMPDLTDADLERMLSHERSPRGRYRRAIIRTLEGETARRQGLTPDPDPTDDPPAQEPSQDAQGGAVEGDATDGATDVVADPAPSGGPSEGDAGGGTAPVLVGGTDGTVPVGGKAAGTAGAPDVIPGVSLESPPAAPAPAEEPAAGDLTRQPVFVGEKALGPQPQPEPPAPPVPPAEDATKVDIPAPAKLILMSKAALTTLCARLSLSTEGTKTDLVNRINEARALLATP